MIAIQYSAPITTSDEILHSAQIIAKAFSDALDQNECNLKVMIGLEHELRDSLDTVKTLKALNDLGANNLTTPSISQNSTGTYTYINPVLSRTTQVVSVAAAVEGLKKNCLKCNLGLPKISLKKQFSFSFDGLKAQLKLYTDVFDSLKNPNFCQVSYAFQYSCIPDILKLIALLLTVYSAILAIRKISSISINAFIKGIISGIVSKILASFSIQIDLSQTGIGCLINALKEIGDAIPDGKNLSKVLSTQVISDANELLAKGGISIDPNYVNPVTELAGNIKEVADGLTAEELFKQLKRQTAGNTDDISKAFRGVSMLVEAAVGDFQEQLQSLFGLVDYLQCELARSGTDFMEILDYMKKIVEIINLLSAIATIVARKQLMARLCATKSSIDNISDLPPNVLYTEFTDLDQADIISEYMGKVTDLTVDSNSDVIPLIYNKDKAPILPKLDFYTCNLKEFIEAHSLPNITRAVLQDIVANQEQINTATDGPLARTNPPLFGSFDLPAENISTTNKWDYYQLQYTKPSFNLNDPITGHATITDAENKVLNSNKENAVKTILDFVYNNPLDRSTNATNLNSTNDAPTSPQQPKVNTPNNTEKTKYSYEGVSGSDRTAFDNQCRKIDDVISLLKNI